MCVCLCVLVSRISYIATKVVNNLSAGAVFIEDRNFALTVRVQLNLPTSTNFSI